MATLKSLRDERLRKLQDIKKLGINPYPADSNRSNYLNDIQTNFDQFKDKSVSVVGRIKGIRKIGKIAFIAIHDSSGDLQLFLKQDQVKPDNTPRAYLNFSEINLLDSGDFIQASGNVIKTQTGEISVAVEKIKLLSKTLRPMPTAHGGFTNKEERLRRRYIDLNINQNVYQRFIRRSNFWQSTRDFLIKNGFIEINVPVLEHTTGGADAKPFITHMESLNQDFYLRISHELPLKKLLGGGYEKVFDIGPRFRNENYSDEHLPEHIAMEWYWAYADWNDGMRFTQDLLRYVCDKTWNKRSFIINDGQEVDLGKDGINWSKISFVEIIKNKYNIDVFNSGMDDIKQKLKENKLEVSKEDNRVRSLDKLWKKIRTEISGPAYLIDIPIFMQPLAKAQSNDPRLSEQFNLILGGTEICKAYSELNDPIDQFNRFLEQRDLRNAGDDEAQMLDIDFIEMLEFGMPPACGFGFSERVFWTLDNITAREGVPFPQLRQEIDELTASIYPEVYSKKQPK
ncbi:MAG TPA: amino acid--tRNA ligase-related protein [Candidatus Dormibacteraeota bacterium]|nr:amino acid--tRNA ligase-related protein [Candidatus Dormibacteraeota bacterium]